MPRRKPSWASGIELAIKPGAVAPGFMLPDTRGRCVRLQSHVEGTHRVKSIMKLHNFPKLISLSPTSLPQTSFTSQVLNSPLALLQAAGAFSIRLLQNRLCSGDFWGTPWLSDGLSSVPRPQLSPTAIQFLSLRSIHSPWWRCPRSARTRSQHGLTADRYKRDSAQQWSLRKSYRSLQ